MASDKNPWSTGARRWMSNPCREVSLAFLCRVVVASGRSSSATNPACPLHPLHPTRAGPMSLATRCCSRQERQDLQRDRQAGHQKSSVCGHDDMVLARFKAIECLFAWRCSPEKLFSPTLAAKRCSRLQIEDHKGPESGYRERCLATSWTWVLDPYPLFIKCTFSTYSRIVS